MATQLVRVQSSPGIQRDGTVTAAQAYVNGIWTRWQRNLPRKMGGYKVTEQYLSNISRALVTQAQSGYRYTYSGNATGVDFFTIDNFGVSSTVIQPPIPATTNPTTTGLPATGNFLNLNSWQFETQFDNATGISLLFAHCNQNLLDPSNGANFPLYCAATYSPNNWNYFTPAGAGPTAETGFIQVPGFGTGSDGHGGTQQALFPNGISGGICSLAPYMTVYGNDGFLAWSAPGYPTDFVGTSQGSLFVGATRITNQKVLKGLPLRGGGGLSPNGLYWSVDSVVRATFIGIPNGTFQFDQITCQSSVLSDRSIIEESGTFYWAGVDRILQYNGVVSEVPNTMNLNFFFDNINQTYAGKSFVMKIPRYGELWFCAPLFGATECNWAIIYNYREKTWYDTQLPNFGRSSGLHADNLIGNLMGGVAPYVTNIAGPPNTYTPTPTTFYNMWEHEQGLDEVGVGYVTKAIPASFTTAPITALASDPPGDTTTHLGILQPDFIQTGDMTVTVLKKNNAAGPQYTGVTATIQANPLTESTGVQNQQTAYVVPLKDAAKIVQLQFTSNVLGGNFQMGRTMVEVSPDGERDT